MDTALIIAQFGLFPFGSSPYTNATSCHTAADCLPEECCLHNLFGKRFLLDDFFGGSGSLSHGRCSDKKAEGEMCIPFGQETTMFGTTAHFAMCPCQDGLTCTSDKTVQNHPIFGSIETHTNTMCSQPEL
ncbi:colipase-like isoform X2 [Watersipora subatra]|uniref:colipase-like isoform X2 n=1 Tax=Watersipora subatra TaxID=2589382 RepID=UPI00355BE863